jgi:serine/threonine protein kinase
MKVNLDSLLSLNTSFSIDLAKYIAYQLVDAVFYLRSKNIVHRDIKADNVMIKIDTFEPVLGDFGFAIQTDK